MEENTTGAVPFLSVTVLNYNYAKYLPACLDSILNQTMRDFEVVIINDCSTDNSLEVIQPYLADPRVRLVNHEVNRGYVFSLLEGSDQSRGRYINVISADDYALDSDAFLIARTTVEQEPEISLFYSAWHEVDNSGHVRHTRRSEDFDYVSAGVDELRRLLMASPVLHSGAIIRHDAYLEVGGYDKSCRYSVDTNMWLTLCSVGKIAYSNTPLYAYRAHDANLSNTDGAFWRATEEMLWGIDGALARFSNEELPDKEQLRRHAWQHALVAVPTLDIFANRLKRGWHGYWLAFKHYPLLTLLQRRTISLVLRTVLGMRGFDSLKAGARRLLSRGAAAPSENGAYSHA